MKTETCISNTDYRTIDGNYAKAVIGYCQYHHGYVTSKQARTHRCHLKHGGVCPRLQDMEKRCIRKVKTEVFYDKMLDRMDKMITAMNKLTRTLEAMQKKNDVYIVNTAANHADDGDE
jgi:hypothetical protein